MFRGQLAESSNRQDLIYIAQLIDEATGEAADLTAATLTFELSGIGSSSPCLVARNDVDDAADVLGITLVEDTTFRVFIPRASMSSLCAGTYEVGLTIENDDITEQIIAGTIAVLNGNVPI